MSLDHKEVLDTFKKKKYLQIGETKDYFQAPELLLLSLKAAFNHRQQQNQQKNQNQNGQNLFRIIPVLTNNSIGIWQSDQPLRDEQTENMNDEDGLIVPESCGTKKTTEKNAMKKNSSFECGAEFAPMVRSFLGLDRIKWFVWVLRSGDVACFGFDNPEKPHILKWVFVDEEQADDFDDNCKKAFAKIDAMGSHSSLSVGGTKEIRCQIGAKHSTKVVEFVETLSS